MLRAAIGPWRRALAQCSTRIRSPVERVLGAGDVAGGEHAGRAGAQVLVDEDPVADGEAGPGGESRARLHADADDDEVALEVAPVARADALDGAVPLEGLHPGPHEHADAVIGVDVAVDAAHLAAQHALQRDRDRGRRG